MYYKVSKISVRLRILLVSGLMISTIVGATETETLVVLFGDSITAGIYVPNGPPGAGLACQPGESPCSACFEDEHCNGIGGGATTFAPPDIDLGQILNKSRRPSILVNWGHGATTSGPSEEMLGNDGAGRIRANLLSSKSQFPAAQNIVLIMYGTNDFSQNLSSTDTGWFIRDMIKKARASDVGFTPVVATIPPRQGEDVLSRNNAITAAANVEGADIVDIYAAISNGGGNLLYDGIHPSLEGYQVIAQSWFDTFLALAIEQQPPSIAPVIFLLLEED